MCSVCSSLHTHVYIRLVRSHFISKFDEIYHHTNVRKKFFAVYEKVPTAQHQCKLRIIWRFEALVVFSHKIERCNSKTVTYMYVCFLIQSNAHIHYSTVNGKRVFNVDGSIVIHMCVRVYELYVCFGVYVQLIFTNWIGNGNERVEESKNVKSALCRHMNVCRIRS